MNGERSLNGEQMNLKPERLALYSVGRCPTLYNASLFRLKVHLFSIQAPFSVHPFIRSSVHPFIRSSVHPFKRICNPLVLVLGFIIRQKFHVDIKRITNPDTKTQRIINPLGRENEETYYYRAMQRTAPLR